MRSEVSGRKSNLKYVLFNVHDTNLSNFLRFVGYWDKYSWDKHVKFGSSIRLELFRQKIPGKPKASSDYLLRVVYDNEDIRPVFCKDLHCTLDEFSEYVQANLMTDLKSA
jgi:hypothetical protein